MGYRRTSSATWERFRLFGLTGAVEFLPMDLIDPGSMIRVLQEVKPDEVNNLAAQSYLGVSFAQPVATGEVNGMGVANIMEAIRTVKASTSECSGRCKRCLRTRIRPFIHAVLPTTNKEGIIMEKSLFEIPQPMPDIKDCYFYHTIDLPEHGTIYGLWDLRHNIKDYLGFVDFSDKRVLDVGTASGFLALEAEQNGAMEVIAFDLSQDEEWDFVPFCNELFEAVFSCSAHDLTIQRKGYLRKIYNGFWFCHHALNSNVKMCYGKAYNIPRGIGEVDVSIFGAILLHMRNPLDALVSAAGLTRQTIIVTDLLWGEVNPDIPVVELIPSINRHPLIFDTWWKISPAFIGNFLQILGFTDTRVNYHVQYSTEDGNRPYNFFTVVARRV